MTCMCLADTDVMACTAVCLLILKAATERYHSTPKLERLSMDLDDLLYTSHDERCQK